MAGNQILLRELLRLGRNPHTYYVRALAPLGIGLVQLILFSSAHNQAGIQAFWWICASFNVASLLGTPFLVVGLLREELESHTLPVLMMAETSLGTILRGLIGSRVTFVVACLFAALPLLVAVVAFGGVTAAQMFQFASLLVSITLFYAAVSLWAAAKFHSREGTLVVIFLLLVVPQAVAMLAAVYEPQILPGWAAWTPCLAMVRLTLEPLPWGMGLGYESPEGATPFSWTTHGDWTSLNAGLIVLSGLFVIVSRYTLARRLRESTFDGRGEARSKREPPTPALDAGDAGKEGNGAESGDRAATRRSTAAHRPIRGNPISWLVLKRFDPLFGIPRTVAIVVTLLAVLFVESLNTRLPSTLAIRTVMTMLGFGVMIWTFLWACYIAAHMWVEERSERTLELLLATPFTLSEVILWKIDAVFWALAPPTVVYSFLLPSMVVVDVGNFATRVLLLPAATMCCFIYSYVGLFVVVYVTTFFAIRATSAVQAVLSALGVGAGLILVNVLGFVFVGSGAILLAFLVDVVALFGFFPLFRERLKSFELQ